MNKRQNLLKYFEVLSEKADKWHNYTICIEFEKVFPKNEVNKVLEVNENEKTAKFCQANNHAHNQC
ncbi:5777_t:CDS:2 [Funneliformis geosporum]|uniref:5777_t:CDS:1 n=1 Tax=Funneliformis geosporum TaxID=1117311 RepID=A0A9W4SF63_9GLOM|nr:5777_t:CDS:2 [Funneliformis geosporum]